MICSKISNYNIKKCVQFVNKFLELITKFKVSCKDIVSWSGEIAMSFWNLCLVSSYLKVYDWITTRFYSTYLERSFNLQNIE